MENNRLIIYTGKKHVYKYYNFEGEFNGVISKKGYYDEHGHYYRNVAFTNKQSIITCKNCQSRFYWQYNKYGVHCPRCYHEINMDIVDTIDKKRKLPSESEKDYSMLSIWTAMFLACSLFLIFAVVMFDKFHKAYVVTAEETTCEESVDNIVYVEELKRDCEKIASNLYYDNDTLCYFKYNTNVTPSQWQYYFVGVSEKYDKDNDKSYGWMTYNNYNKRWQVNINKGEWTNVDSNDYVDRMWHFKSEIRNTIDTSVKSDFYYEN